MHLLHAGLVPHAVLVVLHAGLVIGEVHDLGVRKDISLLIREILNAALSKQLIKCIPCSLPTKL